MVAARWAKAPWDARRIGLLMGSGIHCSSMARFKHRAMLNRLKAERKASNQSGLIRPQTAPVNPHDVNRTVLPCSHKEKVGTAAPQRAGKEESDASLLETGERRPYSC